MIFVIIVYNNEDEVKDFINKQLFIQTYTDFKVYVVVNGGSFSFKKHEKVIVLNPGKNTGYMGALRYVIETEKPDFDFITLCNTDLSLDNNNFLLKYKDEIGNKEFAVAGPRIYSELTQTEQNPLYTDRLTKRKLERLKFFYSNSIFYRLYQFLFYQKKSLSKGSVPSFKDNPYALQGSFITISKDYFNKGGTLSYPVLLYGEELFLAEEARRIGLKNLLVSSLKIRHYEHVTTGKYNFKQVTSMKESVSFILNNYYKNG